MSGVAKDFSKSRPKVACMIEVIFQQYFNISIFNAEAFFKDLARCFLKLSQRYFFIAVLSLKLQGC